MVKRETCSRSFMRIDNKNQNKKKTHPAVVYAEEGWEVKK